MGVHPMTQPKNSGLVRRGNAYYYRRRTTEAERAAMRRLEPDQRPKTEAWVALGSDEAIAREKLRALRDAPPTMEEMTVATLAARWLDEHVAAQRTPRGQHLAAQRVRDFLAPCLGERVAARITRHDLREYRRWLERQCCRRGRVGRRNSGGPRRLSQQSVAHILADVRCLFLWAEEEELLVRAPVPRRLLPRIAERPPDRLSDEDVARLTGLPEPWGFAMRFALGTGLRFGELLRVEAKHVVQGVLTVGHTKSRRVRHIPLPPALIEELRTRVGLLLPQEPGASYSRTYNRIVRSLRRLSGLPGFHPHQLRHTFACRWLEAGGSLAAAQRLLGHASVVTTQRYAAVSDDMLAREVQRVAAGLPHVPHTGHVGGALPIDAKSW